MSILLWICQGLLCIVFLYSGITKSTMTEKQLVNMGQTGVEGIPNTLIHFIGILEVLGVIGLILPYIFNVNPIVTPIVAIGFSLIMIFAGIIHFKRKEYKTVFANFIIFVLSVIVVIMKLAIFN